MNLQVACKFTNVTRLRFNAVSASFAADTRNPALIALLLSWDVSISIWAGYDAVGREFAKPDDAELRYRLWLYDSAKRKHLVQVYLSETETENCWCMAFYNDESKENDGMTHPVRVWQMPRFDVELLKNGMGITTAPPAYPKTLLAENVLRERPRSTGKVVSTVGAGTAVTVVGGGVNYDGCAGWLSVSATSIST